jgi:hypothetical protein
MSPYPVGSPSDNLGIENHPRVIAIWVALLSLVVRFTFRINSNHSRSYAVRHLALFEQPHSELAGIRTHRTVRFAPPDELRFSPPTPTPYVSPLGT